ncbi:hypothetical protein GI582_17875 [Sulfitobacter sp. BDSS02]|nr:hypothetical protein [Sulfitobacter sp. BDSS02]MBR9850896.1 hypothetical protein [Paracoccaceae bacterium]
MAEDAFEGRCYFIEDNGRRSELFDVSLDKSGWGIIRVPLHLQSKFTADKVTRLSVDGGLLLKVLVKHVFEVGGELSVEIQRSSAR